MAKTFKTPGLVHQKAKEKAEQKAKEPEREGNRYVRAVRVLARDDTIDVKILADRAHMSETTAARCKEAWDAVIAALIEVGRLPDPSKKKATPTTKPVLVAEHAATETTAVATPAAIEPAAPPETVAPPAAVDPPETATI